MKHMKKKNEIGAIGIGTLIVFIALILVAAIAAAVIIGTAEDLEERSQQAGDDAQTMVQQVPRIVRAEGQVDASGDIDEVYIYLDYIGSDGVDMNNIVLHVLSSPNNGLSESADLTMNTGQLTIPTSNLFAVEVVIDPLGNFVPTASPPRYIIGEGTMLKLTVDLSLATSALPPDSDLRVEITTSDSGSKTIDVWETPAAYEQAGSIMMLEN